MSFLRLHRTTGTVFFLIVLLISSVAQARDKLVVAIDKSYTPMSFLTPGNVPAGVLVELWELWSRQAGIEVEFALGTCKQTMEMVRSGQADIHSGLFRNDERENWLAFSNTLHSAKSALYHRRHSDTPALDTLDKQRLGAIVDTYQFEFLHRKYPNKSITPYDDHKKLLTGLIRGEVDVVFDEIPTVSRTLDRLGWQGQVSRIPGFEISNTIHAAALKERTDLIKLINSGFQAVDPTLLAAIDSRWIMNPKDRFYHEILEKEAVELTDEEKAFVHDKKTITLASTPSWPPFETRQADGSYAGIAADFVRVAAGKTGLDIQPVFDSDWNAHMEKLENGSLDVAPGLNETSERLENLAFTKPYIEYYSAIFTKADREDIRSPEDLAGKTVVVEDGYAIAKNLSRDHPEIDILSVKTTQDALEAVSAGRADAYVGNQVVASYLIKNYTLPNLKLVSLWRTDLPGQLRFAVNKDNLVLRGILQKGLDAITKQERDAILSTYLDTSGFQQKVFSLTQKQWDWLEAHPRIILGMDPQGAPFEFLDKQGEYQGISVGYIDFLKDKLKIEMTPSDALCWNEVLESARQGRIDVITSVAKTPALEKFLLFTKPYIEFPIVIFSPKEAPLVNGLADIANGRVGVVEGYSAHNHLVADHPELNLALFSNVDEALKALTLGKVDWFVNDLASGSHRIERQGIATLKIAASTEYTMSLAMAVRKDYPELLEILNKALDVISDEQAAEFKGKWLALKFEHGLDMKTVIAWALPVAGGVLLVIGMIMLWNRKLGSEIAERKKAQSELADTLGSLDEKNKMLEGLSSQLAKYLSPQVYDSIFSGNRDVALSTERKKLTVFFSDIKDFTQTTDDMQPEDLTSLLNSYFTEMAAIALEYGATIDKFIGDAMLMFFGDPETKGVMEDAKLCVRMALAMQKRMAELEKEWQQVGYKPFRMRVGVNTGYCNVGNFGSETRMDYTIIGGEVNLAARLEAEADPGGVLISSETYMLVQDMVNVEERAPLSFRGIHKSIRPYAVISLRDDENAHTGPARTITHQDAGVELSVDLDMLTPEKRRELSQRLKEIARQLTDE